MVVNPEQVWAAAKAQQNIEMVEMSPPVATSERKQSFELENLEGSPGNTLRERHRRITSPVQDIDDPEDQPSVEMLHESPGAGRNRRIRENQSDSIDLKPAGV